MHRFAFAAAVLTLTLSSAPSFAVTAKDKMATCKFGADDQKLTGATRAAFMKKCMSTKNDPRGPGPAPPPKQ